MEQVADSLLHRGHQTIMVAGSGTYREGRRPPPESPLHRLPTHTGQRGNLASTALEYVSVHRGLTKYIAAEVHPGDVVVINSAPPTTLFLHSALRARQATGIYWLQDYYPQLIRGLWDPPALILRWLHGIWTQALSRWDFVVKSAANLGYDGPNARVIRNWNTVVPGPPRPARPRTALYSGNLGYGHDLGAFLQLCERLRAEGYSILVRGDGPGMRKLPDWIRPEAPLVDPTALLESYQDAEVHLIAADPRITGAVFPSKLWNALAHQRKVLASGFEGPMAEELERSLKVDFRMHLAAWTDFLEGTLSRGNGESE